MSSKTCLVTGVPGWLGNRFLEVLAGGYNGEGPSHHYGKIRCLIQRKSDAEILSDQFPEIQFFEGDLCHPETIARTLSGIDDIFHLAGIIHPTHIREFEEINTQGTCNLLRAAVEASVKRILYVSSNSAGGFTRRPYLMKESDRSRPYMSYGWSKYLAEKAIQQTATSGKIEAIILRPCWYYGTGQPERQTRFFRMIKRGNPILFGDGMNLRSLSYLDNVIDALLLSEKADRADGVVYWISDERPYTTLEIYRTIADLLEVTTFWPRHLPQLTSEICRAADWGLQKIGLYQQEIHVAGEMNKNIACSIERAKRELNYQPRIGLREGMRISIEWCRRHGVEI